MQTSLKTIAFLTTPNFDHKKNISKNEPTYIMHITTCEGRGRRATPRQRTGTTFSKYASEPRVGSSNIIAYTFKKLQS